MLETLLVEKGLPLAVDSILGRPLVQNVDHAIGQGLLVVARSLGGRQVLNRLPYLPV